MALSRTFAVGEILTAEDVNDHLVNRVPTPGAAYDTGWVPIPLATGILAGSRVPEVRRIGPIVYAQGFYEPDNITTGGETKVGELDPLFRPLTNQAMQAASAYYGEAGGFILRIYSGGDVGVTVTNAAAWFAIDGTYWVVD